MQKLLWLDDYRNPMEGDWLVFSPLKVPNYEVVWVKNYQEFVLWIVKHGLPDGICFDHDLGPNAMAEIATKDMESFDYDNLKGEMTGYDCAKWLVRFCENNNKTLPLYNIQSGNPVGKKNIDMLLKNFIKSSEFD